MEADGRPMAPEDAELAAADIAEADLSLDPSLLEPAAAAVDPLTGAVEEEELVLQTTFPTEDVEIPALPDDDIDGNPADDLPGIGDDPNLP